MNNLVSGAIGVAVPITNNKIYIPDIADLRGKVIKYIDVCDLVTETVEGLNCLSNFNNFNAYFNLIEEGTKDLRFDNLNINMLRLSQNNGNRFPINLKISLPQSYITIDAPVASTYIYLVFWFDDPKMQNPYKEEELTTTNYFEVNVQNTSTKQILFPENRTLFNKEFRNIMNYATTNGSTPNGRPLVDDELFFSSFLTLQKENYRYIRSVPVYVFNQVSQTWPLRLQNIKFDFTNSFIEVSPNTQLVAGTSFMFNSLNKL